MKQCYCTRKDNDCTKCGLSHAKRTIENWPSWKKEIAMKTKKSLSILQQKELDADFTEALNEL
jgi:hypothetical protein